jgi:hypothetical protein
MVQETGQPYAYTGDDPVNRVDPLGLCTISGEGQLYAGPCATTGAEAIAAEKGIQAQAGGSGFSFSAGLSAVENVADDVGNAVVHHPLQVAGLALGVLSIASGVGAALALGEVVELSAGLYGLGSAATGVGAALVDSRSCFGPNSDSANRTIACTGVAAGGLGVLLGSASLIPGVLAFYAASYALGLGSAAFLSDLGGSIYEAINGRTCGS